MIQVVSSHANPIRLPLNRVHTTLKLKKLEESLTKKLNRKPTLEELAESAMMRPQDLQRFIRDIPNVVSMDSTPVDSDEDLFLRDVITDTDYDPLAEAEKRALDQELEEALSCLTDKERIVVNHRFGLNDTRSYTLEEIGKLLGVTRERVRQIEAQALDKLRNPRRCENQIAEWEKQRETLVNNGDIEHVKSREFAAPMILAMRSDVPYRLNGNVMNTGLITNLPRAACVEVPCMVDRNGINPCVIGDLPEQLAALNRTNINVQLMTMEAARSKKRADVYMAAYLDPHTAAELSLDDIRSMCDDLFEAHKDWLPEYR